MRVPSLSGDVKERDSLASTRVRRGLPCPPYTRRPGKGRGAGPREWARWPWRRVLQNNHSPEKQDWQFNAAPPPGQEPGAQSRLQGGRGRAWSSAPSAAPPGAAGALGTQGIRAALRPGLAGRGAAGRGRPAYFSLSGLAAHCFPPISLSLSFLFFVPTINLLGVPLKTKLTSQDIPAALYARQLGCI